MNDTIISDSKKYHRIFKNISVYMNNIIVYFSITYLSPFIKHMISVIYFIGVL